MGEARRELRVLVADDDEAIQLCLGDVLKGAGCRVHMASDGIEAVRILEAVSVDLVITDYDMPRMSGLELIRWCQAILPGLPTLLISGHDLQKVVGKFARRGAHRVLQKPFTGEQLLCVVGELCGAELPA
jgi:CheY-like chemotaxis protein